MADVPIRAIGEQVRGRANMIAAGRARVIEQRAHELLRVAGERPPIDRRETIVADCDTLPIDPWFS